MDKWPSSDLSSMVVIFASSFVFFFFLPRTVIITCLLILNLQHQFCSVMCVTSHTVRTVFSQTFLFSKVEKRAKIGMTHSAFVCACRLLEASKHLKEWQERK